MSDIDLITYLSANKQELMKQFKLVTLGIFGSYARNEYDQESDIDIFVDFEKDTQNIFEKNLN